jgi:threonyl-tRNA synthetase
MKILSIHCDYIRFKPLKKALKQPEELTEERKELTEVKEPLVIFTAVEKQDETNQEIVAQFSKEVEDIARQVNAEKIVLYPYAHLSSSLSKPDFAMKTLEEADKLLSKKFSVIRAPFGFYKEFELKCKGHPLSELSREIISKGEVKEIEEKIDYRQLLREISKSKLDTKELKENDHRIIGKQMDLFSFSELAPGMVFWHNNGLLLRNSLIDFWREEQRKACYHEIQTPQIMDAKLWKISGHWRLYKENMFLTDYEEREFAVKPMNCPGGMLVFRNSPKSYKDLPLRVAELGIVHRKELSGVLSGLFRVIQFTQDDAHIFCTEKQLESEIISIIELTSRILDVFGFKYRYTLSTRSEAKKDKYLGDNKMWNKAENAIKKSLAKLKIRYDETPGEAKFYGPSLDVQIKDSLGREWQCATIQLDMQLPERFDLSYTDKDNKSKRPVMLHRVIYGSLERFIGILLEHTKGHLPLWLSPKQVRVINFADRNNKSCEKLCSELLEHGFRTDLDLTQEPLNGKIKQAEIEKIPYIVVIGDKEEKAGTLAVRYRGKVTAISRDEFIEKLKKEVLEKK